MSITPLAAPIRRAMTRTALRRLVTNFEDWADTAQRAEAYWRQVSEPVAAAGSAGENKAYSNCANHVRTIAAALFPEGINTDE